MGEKTRCRECERTLLDILETVDFDLATGCWVETDRTPLFSICRIYLAYICGEKDGDPSDIDFSKIHVCQHYRFNDHECCNPEHLRPAIDWEPE
jgi:hypothetical protein